MDSRAVPARAEAPPGPPRPSAAATGEADDILRADPRYRVAVAVVAAIGLGLGALGIILFRRHLVSLYVLAVEDPAAAVESFFRLASSVFLGFGVLVTLVGVHTFVAARRAYRSGQVPAPGTRVLRDTPVVRGPRARREARRAMLLAGLVVGLGLATPFFGAYVLPRLVTTDGAVTAIGEP